MFILKCKDNPASQCSVFGKIPTQKMYTFVCSYGVCPIFQINQEKKSGFILHKYAMCMEHWVNYNRYSKTRILRRKPAALVPLGVPQFITSVELSAFCLAEHSDFFFQGFLVSVLLSLPLKKLLSL
jgi:hypothetical protein